MKYILQSPVITSHNNTDFYIMYLSIDPFFSKYHQFSYVRMGKSGHRESGKAKQGDGLASMEMQGTPIYPIFFQQEQGTFKM